MTKRKFSRKYGGRKKRKFSASTASAVKAIVKKTNAADTEYKHYTYATSTNLSTTSYWANISTVGQGVSSDNRIGYTIKPTSLILRYRVRGTDGLVFSNDQYNNVRIMVVQWFSDSNNDPPSMGRILENLGTAPVGCEQYNVRDKTEYNVLYDKCHKLETTAAYYNTTNSTAYTFTSGTNTLRIKVYPTRKINYRTGGSTSATTGSIWLFAVSDSSATPHPELYYSSKLTYSDK